MICKEFNASSHRRLDSQDPKYNMNRDEAEREAEISDLVEMDEDERENEKGYSEVLFSRKKLNKKGKVRRSISADILNEGTVLPTTSKSLQWLLNKGLL